MPEFTTAGIAILLATQGIQLIHTFFKEFQSSSCKINMKNEEEDQNKNIDNDI